MKVLLERFPIVILSVEHLRSTVCPTIAFKKQIHGQSVTWICIYDNGMQLTTAMEDFEYTKWLDPDRVPCYVRDRYLNKTDNLIWNYNCKRERRKICKWGINVSL